MSERTSFLCFGLTGLPRYFPWQRLYFFPLLHGHLVFRPIFPCSGCILRFSSHLAQVQAVGCSLYQFVLVAIIT